MAWYRVLEGRSVKMLLFHGCLAKADVFFHDTSVASGNAISPCCPSVLLALLLAMALTMKGMLLASGMGSSAGSAPQRHGGVRMYLCDTNAQTTYLAEVCSLALKHMQRDIEKST